MSSIQELFVAAMMDDEEGIKKIRTEISSDILRDWLNTRFDIRQFKEEISKILSKDETRAGPERTMLDLCSKHGFTLHMVFFLFGKKNTITALKEAGIGLTDAEFLKIYNNNHIKKLIRDDEVNNILLAAYLNSKKKYTLTLLESEASLYCELLGLEKVRLVENNNKDEADNDQYEIKAAGITIYLMELLYAFETAKTHINQAKNSLIPPNFNKEAIKEAILRPMIFVMKKAEELKLPSSSEIQKILNKILCDILIAQCPEVLVSAQEVINDEKENDEKTSEENFFKKFFQMLLSFLKKMFDDKQIAESETKPTQKNKLEQLAELLNGMLSATIFVEDRSTQTVSLEDIQEETKEESLGSRKVVVSKEKKLISEASTQTEDKESAEEQNPMRNGNTAHEENSEDSEEKRKIAAGMCRPNDARVSKVFGSSVPSARVAYAASIKIPPAPVERQTPKLDSGVKLSEDSACISYAKNFQIAAEVYQLPRPR